jgi:rhodanese-related sulfurtransferase
MEHFAGALFLLAVIGLLGYRVWKQQAFLKQVRTSRLDPVELKRMLDGGQNPYIVDLRHPLDYLPDPRVLPGAIRLSPETLMQRSGEIPRDRDVILYCTCPSEATAAKMAMKLRQNGIYRVRPCWGASISGKSWAIPWSNTRNSRQASPDSAVRKHSDFPPLVHFPLADVTKSIRPEENSCQGGEFAQRIDDNSARTTVRQSRMGALGIRQGGWKEKQDHHFRGLAPGRRSW